MGSSSSVHPDVAYISNRVTHVQDLNDDLKRIVSQKVCKRVAKLSSKPLKARLVVSYNEVYDDIIHKRILGFRKGWAEIHGSYGENTCVNNSDVDFMRILDKVCTSPQYIKAGFKVAFIVVDDLTRMPPGSCWLRLFYTNTKDKDFNLPVNRNGLEWFMNCQDSNLRGYAPPYCRGSKFDEQNIIDYPYESFSDVIVRTSTWLKTDKYGQMFINRAKVDEYYANFGLTYLKWFNKLLPKWISHGPANSQKYFGIFDVDVVEAFHCSTGWPNSANEWLTRPRIWPSEELVKTIGKSGFHVIPICSKMLETEDSDLEWRLSFRTAESLLIRAFNKYQRLVYITLKIIVKEFIQPKFPDEDFMSSYIMKMLVFWESEETAQSDWTEGHFINCLNTCLRRLRQWLNDGVCPSYFIPEYNLFRTKIDRMFVLGFREWLISEIEQKGWTIILHCSSLKLSRTLAKLISE